MWPLEVSRYPEHDSCDWNTEYGCTSRELSHQAGQLARPEKSEFQLSEDVVPAGWWTQNRTARRRQWSLRPEPNGSGQVVKMGLWLGETSSPHTSRLDPAAWHMGRPWRRKVNLGWRICHPYDWLCCHSYDHGRADMSPIWSAVMAYMSFMSPLRTYHTY